MFVFPLFEDGYSNVPRFDLNSQFSVFIDTSLAFDEIFSFFCSNLVQCNVLTSLSLGNMGPSNVDFKLLRLNARGIRTFEKRKVIFSWLSKSGADICILQETYSTRDVENIWKNQWRGNLFFSHGTCHRKGVLELVKKQFGR